MSRLLPLATALVATTLLAGCAPGTPMATETPVPTATESATPTTSPTPTAEPRDPLAGTCDELLTPAQVASLFSPVAVSQGDTTATGGGRASTEPEILALMPAGGRHCTWVVPDSDGGMIVSVLPADAAIRAAVTAQTAEFFTRDAGPGVTYDTFESLDQFTFTETHALGDGATDYWVAVFTSGGNAREIAEIVWLDLIGT